MFRSMINSYDRAFLSIMPRERPLAPFLVTFGAKQIWGQLHWGKRVNHNNIIAFDLCVLNIFKVF